MSDGDYDTWLICRHRFPETGQSAVVTVNSSFENRAAFVDFPYHVSIVIGAAGEALDASGRIGAHESQHLLGLTRVMREALDSLDVHLLAIVHGAGARTLDLYARDGEAVAQRLRALKDEKTWDRPWTFEIAHDPTGRRSEAWRKIAAAAEDHHLAVNVPHTAGGADHHHYLF